MAVFKHLLSMAMVSLIVLVIQNSLLVVMTRFSRKNVEVTLNYHTSTLVLNQECVKMLMCLVIYAFDDVWKQFYRESTTGTTVAVGANTTTAEEAEAIDVPSRDDASSNALLRGNNEKMLSPGEHSLTLPFRESQGTESPPAGAKATHRGEDDAVAAVPAEDEACVAATGIVPTMRRTVRVAAPALSPPPAGASSFSPSKSTDVAYPRRSKLRFTWLRTQQATRLYCTMLRTAVLKRDTLKLLVPACLFNLQNFLIFVGLSNLDAVSFQVWSQTKLLSTALFSVWLLHRRLSVMQWLSLVALTAGVLGAQLGAPKSGAPAVSPYAATSTTTTSLGPRSHQQQQQHTLRLQQHLTRAVQALAGREETTAAMDGDEEPQANALIGIAACVLSGLSSSYAGVYFEKVVKTTSPTLSIRNIQLSVFGIPLAFVSMLLLDVVPSWYAQHQCGDPVHWNIFANPFRGDGKDVFDVSGDCPVRPFYFWQRYDHPLTWALVGIHAFGGLLVAIVVKYADNILKGFATGVAVIVSGMMSSVIWGYKPSIAFVLGAVLVIGSSIAFHKFEPKR